MKRRSLTPAQREFVVRIGFYIAGMAGLVMLAKAFI